MTANSDLSLALSRMLVTRLCHDLAGPLGAVATGVEFLSEAGEADPSSLGLIASSAKSAIDRLKLLRTALGRAGGQDGADLPVLLAGYFEAVQGARHPVEIDWEIDRDFMAAADTVQMLALLVLLTSDAMARISVLRVALEGGAVVISATGRALAEDRFAALQAACADPASVAVEPGTATGMYAALMADEIGCEMTLSRDENGVRVFLREKS